MSSSSKSTGDTRGWLGSSRPGPATVGVVVAAVATLASFAMPVQPAPAQPAPAQPARPGSSAPQHAGTPQSAAVASSLTMTVAEQARPRLRTTARLPQASSLPSLRSTARLPQASSSPGVGRPAAKVAKARARSAGWFGFGVFPMPQPSGQGRLPWGKLLVSWWARWLGLADPTCTDTWTGRGDGTTWEDGANWSSDSVPGSSDYACLPPLTPTAVTLSSSVSIAGLLVEGGTSLTLTGAGTSSLTVSGTITNDGTIISDPGTSSQGSRSIYGNLTNAAGGTIDVNYPLSVDSYGCSSSPQPTSFDTSGTIDVAAGQTLYVDDSNCGPIGTFDIAGGTITNNGTIDDHSGPGNGTSSVEDLNVTAGTLTGSPVIAFDVAVDFSGSGSGTYELAGGNNTLSGDVGAGYTLVVYTGGFNQGGWVTASSDVTNHGTIELTNNSTSGYRTSGFTMSSGTLTNDGTIISEPGPGPGQSPNANVIDGNLTNAAGGTIDVNFPLSVASQDANPQPNSTFATSGTLDVAKGQTLSVDNYAYNPSGTFEIDGGTVTNDGSIYDHTGGPDPNQFGSTGASLVASGGTLSGNPVIALNVAANLSGSGSGTYELAGGNNTLSGDVGAGYTLVVYTGGFNQVGWVTASSDVTNHGTIELTDDSTGSYRTSGFTMSSGTLTNDGTIISEPGGPSPYANVIDGNLTNASGGTIDVNFPLSVDDCDSPAGSVFATSGTLTVGSSQTLYVDNHSSYGCPPPGTFEIAGGTIANHGAIEDHPAGDQATLTVSGGMLSGNPVIAFDVAAGFSGSGSGTFEFAGGNNTLSGDLTSGYTVWTHTIDALGGGSAAMRVPPGDILTNASGAIKNDGSIYVGRASASNVATFVEDAGTATGNPVQIVNGDLAFEGTGSSSFLVPTGGTATVSGTIGSSQSLAVGGVNYANGGAVATASAGFANSGTLSLAPGWGGSVLNLPAALPNSGTIVFTGGEIAGAVDNTSSGTISVTGGSSDITGSVTNSGTITIAGGNLDITGSVTNPGTITVTAGTLDLAGGLTNLSGTTLTGGTYKVLGTPPPQGQIGPPTPGTLAIPNASIQAIAASVELAPGGSFVDPAAGNATSLKLSQVAAKGSLTLDPGASLATPSNGPLTNDGTITVSPTATLDTGAYTQDAGGTLGVGIAGEPSTGELGTLQVSGTATLAGTLAIEAAAGFTPKQGDSYPVVSAATLSGTFSQLTGASISPALSYTPKYTSTGVDLVVEQAGADLAAESITGPDSAQAGSRISLSWRVTSVGSDIPPSAAWSDEVYLSREPDPTPDALVLAFFYGAARDLGGASHSGALSSGQSYQQSVTAAVPGVLPGKYYLVLFADASRQLAETSVADNIVSVPISVTVPSLSLSRCGRYPCSVTGSVAGGYGNSYYQVTPPAGSNFEVQVSFASAGSGQMFESFAAIPGPLDHDQSAPDTSAATQTVAVAAGQGGAYYVDLNNPSAGAVTYTIRAFAVTLAVTSVAPPTATYLTYWEVFGSSPLYCIGCTLTPPPPPMIVPGPEPEITATIYGAGFTSTTTASLSCPSTVRPSPSATPTTTYVSPTELYADFGPAFSDGTVTIGSLLANLQTSPGGEAVDSLPTTPLAYAVPSGTTINLVVPPGWEGGETVTTTAPAAVGATSVQVTPFNPSSELPAGTSLEIRDSSCDVVVHNGRDSASLAGAITLTGEQLDCGAAAGPLSACGELPEYPSVSVSAPSINRPDLDGIVWVNYSNPYPYSIPAPLMRLSVFQCSGANSCSTGAATLHWWGQPASPSDGNAILLLGTGPSGNPGVLEPGARGTIGVAFDSLPSLGAHNYVWFGLDILAYPDNPVNFGQWLSWTLPEGTPQALSDFVTEQGGTLSGAQIQARLDSDVTYLSTLGEYPGADVASLLDYEANKITDYGAMLSNYSVGPFGYGLPGLVDHLSVDSSGDVTLTDAAGHSVVFYAGLNGYCCYAAPGVDSRLYSNNPEQVPDPTPPGNGWVMWQPDGSRDYFNTSGVLVSSVDGYHNTTTYTYASGASGPYDYAGQELTSIAYPDGDTLSFTYYPLGELASVTDSATGQTVTYEYQKATDGTLRLFQIQTQGATTHLSWDDSSTDPALYGTLSSITTPDGVTDTFAYDSSGRLTQVDRSDGTKLARLAYNGDSSVSVTDAEGNTATEYPDEIGFVLKTILPNGETETASLSPGGFGQDPGTLTSTTIGSTTNSYSYALLGAAGGGAAPLDALTGITNPLGQSESLQYGNGPGLDSVACYPGAAGLTGFTEPSGSQTSFGLDCQGSVTSATFPDGATQSLTYSASGLVQGLSTADGDQLGFTYDSSREITGISLPGGGQSTYTYDSHHNVTSATGAAGTTTYTFDSSDHLTKVAYPNGLSVSYTYDAADRRATMTTSDGYQLKYAYDSADRLASITDGSGTVLASYAYTADDQLAQITNANGTTTSYTYDPVGDIASVTNKAKDGSVTSSFTYTRNGLGEATKVTYANGQTASYTYDAAGQLTSAALPGGRSITYSYDADGNLTQVVDSGAGTTAYTTNSSDEYTQAAKTSAGTTTYTTYSYDAAGNLVRSTDGAGSTNYTWSALGQLSQVSGPAGTTSYTYDASGTPLAETSGATTTNLLTDPLDGNVLLGTYDTSGTATAHYVVGAGLAALSKPSGTSFYGFDGSGNVVSLSDSTGAVTDTYQYLPYGTVASTTGTGANPFRFEGQFGLREDLATGLYSAGARYYDPATARFVSPDPTVMSGPNPYQYAANDPIDSVDTSGNGPYFSAQYMNEMSGGTSAPLSGSTLVTGGAQALGFQTSNPSDTPTDTGVKGVQNGLKLSSYIKAGTSQIAKNLGGEPEEAISTALKGLGTAINGITGVIGVGYNGYKAATATNYVDRTSYVSKAALAYVNMGVALSINAECPGCSVWIMPAVGAGEYVVDKSSQSFFNWLERYQPPAKNDIFGPAVTDRSAQETSGDPNAVIGTAGYGFAANQSFSPGSMVDGGFVKAGTPLAYQVNFTNEATASAPAQTVTVTDKLDPSVDPTTFSLGRFGFASHIVTPPAGMRSYSTTIDDTAASGLDVHVRASLDSATRTVTWTFTSIDPSTGLPTTNPAAGFLPPDKTPPEGEGFVSYSVLPAGHAVTGTTISDSAKVVFDVNAPIVTDTYTNTLDTAAPTASVNPLPATTTSPFTVSWTGSDGPGGSGIASYDVWYSDSGGPLQALEAGTTTTSTSFNGQVGHTYAFVATATDNVGNAQALPTSPQALTTVMAPPPPGAPSSSVTELTGPSPNPPAAGGTGVTYTFGFTTSSIATLAAGTGTISLTAPTGTVFPRTPGDYLVNGAPVALPVSGAGTDSVTITSPVAIGASSPVTVAVTRMTNPPAGSGLVASVSTSADLTPVDTPTYTIYPGSAYTPIDPVRVADTRCAASPQPSFCSGENLPSANSGLATVPAGGTINVKVAGVDGIPSTATAVVLNVAAVDATTAGYLTVYPAGSSRAVVSSLNWRSAPTGVANMVTVALGKDGEVSVYNDSGTTDVILDAQGYYDAASGTAGLYNPLTPARLADTRCAASPQPSFCSEEHLPSVNSSLEAVGPGATINLRVTGVGGVPPAGVSAVVLHVTAVEPSANTYITAYPAGSARAIVANLNVPAGQVVPNRVIVGVGSNGQVTLYNNSGTVDLVVDVAGYYTDSSTPAQTGSLFNPLTPARLADTRCAASPQPSFCSGEHLPAANSGLRTLAPNGTEAVTTLGVGGVPAAGVSGVDLNVTITDPTTSSYLTIWPDGAPRPVVSDLNWAAGGLRANAAVEPVPGTGKLDLYNDVGSVDVVIDADGWFSQGL